MGLEIDQVSYNPPRSGHDNFTGFLKYGTLSMYQRIKSNN